MAKIDWKLDDTVMPADANIVGTEIETIKSILTTQEGQFDSRDSRISTIEDNYVNKSGSRPLGINAVPPSAVQQLPTSKITDLKNFIVDTIYPINSVVQLASDQDPNTLFGGTWVRFAEGRTIIGRSSTDGLYGINNQGGSKHKTITQENLPSHTHNITIEAAGRHNHTLSNANTDYKSLKGGIYNIAARSSLYSLTSTGVFTALLHGVDRGYATSSNNEGNNSVSFDASHSHTVSGYTVSNGSHAHSATVASTGSGSLLDIMPPYIVVGMWRRTA